MAIITISRQFASEGDAIARSLAKKLKYPLIDKEALEKIFQKLGYADFSDVYDQNNIWSRFDSHHSDMVRMLQRIYDGVCHLNHAILLGRGGYAAIKPPTNYLNIKIQAPFEKRVERTMRMEGIRNLEIAQKIVEEEDQRRREFIEALSEGNWDDAGCFDLVIDSSKIPPEMAVEWIEQAASWLDRSTRKPPPTAPAKHTNDAIDTAIADVLARR